MSQPMNLVVYLARGGLGSRRVCDELVRKGQVTVNGEVVTFPREKIAPEDVVAVNGDAERAAGVALDVADLAGPGPAAEEAVVIDPEGADGGHVRAPVRGASRQPERMVTGPTGPWVPG